MTVIISGANGFIGSRLVKKFAQNGQKVIALVKDKLDNIGSISEFAKIVYCDFSDLDSTFNEIKTLVDGDCTVYHLAWIGVNGAQKADYSSQIQNVKMTCDCALLAKRLNAKRFLVSGTVAENAVESYSKLQKLSGGLMYATAKCATKLFVETVCKNVDLPYVWMQFSNIYGPDNKTGNLVSYTISQLINEQKATFGPALQPYDFIFADDLIEAAYRLGVTDVIKCSEYFIGSGKPKLLKDYLIAIGEAMGRVDLIDIGARFDDGIRYDTKMFDTSKLIQDIGNYISLDFDQAIRYTIDNYFKE